MADEALVALDREWHERVDDPFTLEGLTAQQVMALAMQHHLGIAFEDDRVMCLCHAPNAFEGPVFHRRHVAQVIDAYLTAAGYRIIGPEDEVRLREVRNELAKHGWGTSADGTPIQDAVVIGNVAKLDALLQPPVEQETT
jgi:hypothetical protein